MALGPLTRITHGLDATGVGLDCLTHDCSAMRKDVLYSTSGGATESGFGSATLHDLTLSAGDLRFAEVGEVQLKVLAGAHRIYRAIW